MLKLHPVGRPGIATAGSISAMIVAAAALCADRAIAADSVLPRYIHTPLPELPGAFKSTAYGINDEGIIVGECNQDGNVYQRAVVWIDGEIVVLTGLEISGATAYAVNGAATIVGFTDEFLLGAFTWHRSILMELPPGNCCAAGHDINEAGLIVGLALITNQPGAVVWQDGEMSELPTLGGPSGAALAVNNRNQIVGYSSRNPSGFPSRAALWQNGTVQDLGTLGGAGSDARGINDGGTIVGRAQSAAGAWRPVYWKDGEIVELPAGPPAHFLYAEDINEGGIIIGFAPDAVIWLDGELHLLHDLTVNLADGESFWRPQAINNKGQIVGQTGSGHAFLLTPVKPGDLDFDGAVDVLDLLELLSAWGTCEGETPGQCPADINGDGAVDVQDLLLLLAHWG